MVVKKSKLMSKPENNIILYQDENGVTRVNVRFSGEDLWLTELQIAEIYDTSRQNINLHIANIYKNGELPADSTCKKYLRVQTEGKRHVERNIDHYNLDMIIAIGYRVQSQIATRFDRVDNKKPLIGMTNFKGDYITKDDVKIAKNYLSEIELTRLNLLVSQFLDYAEFTALEQQPMAMEDWIVALDNQIIALRRKVLKGTGHISHKQAIEKAEKEFEMYRAREMRQMESDFDRAVKKLAKLERKSS